MNDSIATTTNLTRLILTTTAAAVTVTTTSFLEKVAPTPEITTTTNNNNNLQQEQCDYALLFSHLPQSFQLEHFKYFTFQQQQQQGGLAATTSSSPANSLQSQYQQQSAFKLCFAVFAVLFGLFYSLIGYRFLKLATFIIGFSLGSTIIYLILSEQKQLTLVENLIISLSIGVLFAFVALLIQYIGLFLLGITSSISVVTCIFILIDLFYTNKSAWLCIGLLFLCATVVASFTLKFQKSFTILNTSAIGSGLLLIALDFFVENNLLLDYIFELYKVNANSFNMYERQKILLRSSSDFTTSTTTADSTAKSFVTSTKAATTLFETNKNSTSINGSSSSSSSALALFLHLYSSAHARLCWYTWLIFGSYFVLLFISLLIQFLLTGRNYDHRDSWHKLIKGSRKKKSANLEKIRLKSQLNEQSNQQNRAHHGGTMHQQIDTLLLVESGETVAGSTMNTNSRSVALLDCTVSSTSDHNHHNHHHRNHHNAKKGAKQSKQKKRASSRQQPLQDSEHLEIVSFEVINDRSKSKLIKKDRNGQRKQNQESSTSTSSSGSSSNQKGNRAASESSQSTESSAVKPINLASVSTTSSTSSTSSTCQLINTKSTPAETHLLVNPSAPPAPSAPPITAVISTGSISLLPPPVPTSQPPAINAAASTLLNQTKTSSSQLQLKNISKLKHHRSSVNKEKDGKEDGSVSANDKFRHFYQVRRNNGDVLSQDFINNIQNKLSSSSNLNTNANNNNNNTCNSNIVNEPQSTSSPKSQRSASLSSDKKKSNKTKKF